MANLLAEMNDRSREVFRRVVEAYLSSGDPVGSRTLTRQMSEKVSAATIRNVMQDLEYLGLLDSPHISAGRLPTQAGLRMFVDGLLEVSDLSLSDREKLDETLGNGHDVAGMLDRVGTALSGLTQGASLVLAPKHEAPIRHIEFVLLAADRALAVLVFQDGHVENRVFVPPPGQTASALREASNFLSAIAEGKTIAMLRRVLEQEIGRNRAELDSLAADLVKAGLAVWEETDDSPARLIVRGQANLLEAGVDSGRYGTHPHPVRRSRTKEGHCRVPRSHRSRRRRADLHRLGEQAFLTFGFLSGGLSLYER